MDTGKIFGSAQNFAACGQLWSLVIFRIIIDLHVTIAFADMFTMNFSQCDCFMACRRSSFVA